MHVMWMRRGTSWLEKRAHCVHKNIFNLRLLLNKIKLDKVREIH